MFGWIAREFDSVSGLIDNTVRQWVRDLVNGLYGFLHAVFGLVSEGWENLVSAAYLAWHSITSFMDETVLKIYYILRQVIPAVVKAYKDSIALVDKYARDVYSWATREFQLVRDALDAAFNALKKFVIDDIWKPLDDLVTSALKWITTRGETVWHYISNPVDLVDLLWDYLIAKLEAEAWNIGEKLGSFFLALVIKNLPRFVKLLEDILNAVF